MPASIGLTISYIHVEVEGEKEVNMHAIFTFTFIILYSENSQPKKKLRSVLIPIKKVVHNTKLFDVP